MYKTITVIGLGTLGGFLCKHLSEIDHVKELIIVDYDIVESKNVFKSIYNFKHVGDYKVNALADIIDDDVRVTKIREKYEEGKTILPKSDLVIDCRDVVCDRKNEINIRLYVSDKTLIVDCRKKVQNSCSYDGSYTIQLTKSEISKAAFFASQIIEKNQIDNMIRNELIQKIDLDLISSIMSTSIQKTIKSKIDMIYDMPDQKRRLYCIEENINPILKLNKQQDIEVFVGQKEKTKTNELSKLLEDIIDNTEKLVDNQKYLIPKNKLNSSLDVITALTNIIKHQPGVTNFIITIKEENGEQHIELLEETGAA